MDGAHDKRSDSRLHAGEYDSERRTRLKTVLQVQPRQKEHQNEARQHEAQSRENAADASPRKHAEVNTKLVRFRSGQYLVHRKHSVEVLRCNPLLFGDEFLADHRDLRDGSTPSQGTELQEAQKQRAEGLVGNPRRRVIGRGCGTCRLCNARGNRQSMLLTGVRHQSKPWTLTRLGIAGRLLIPASEVKD